MSLMQHHREILHASAISDEVIEAARIQSVTHWRELLEWGFKPYQAKGLQIGPEAPAMLFPMFGAAGLEPAHARVRPDVLKEGAPKYVQPAGVPLSLYVPPMCQARLKTCCPKFVTEGEKKALALATLGECAIGLSGVTGSRGRNKEGGLTRLADWEEIALNDSRSYICFDSDTVHKVLIASMLIRLHKWIQNVRRGTPFIVITPTLPGQKKTGIDDYIFSGKNLLDVVGLARTDVPDLAKIKAEQDAQKRDPNGPPMIETNGVRLQDMTAAAMSALCAKNAAEPRLFIRGGRIVQILSDEHGRPAAHELRKEGLRHYLERSAEWVSTSEKRGTVPVPPRVDVCEDILARPDIYDLPPLAGITTAPTFGADGTLLDTPGYHRETQTYYQPAPGFVLPDTTPTPENVAAAKDLLLGDLLVDFPMVDDASRANGVGLVLEPFVKPMIKGPSPLFVIDAPAAGTGKTKQALMSMVPFLGRVADARPAPSKPEEWDKSIFAAVAGGAPVVLWDNARRLDSPTLDLILTATSFTSRVLGVIEERTFLVRQTWIATSNNLTIGGDLGRRCVWIRQDAGVEKPELRSGFKHDPIEDWAIQNHAALAGACVTLIRSWIEAGVPAYTGTRKGSYEGWCNVVGGILQHLGIKGFLDNSDAAVEHMDQRPAMWRAFFAEWYETHEDRAKIVGEIQDMAIRCIPDEIGDREGRSLSMKISALLRAHTDRVYGGLRLVSAGRDSHTKTAAYRITCANSAVPAVPAVPFLPYVGQYPENHIGVCADTSIGAGEKVPQDPQVPQITSSVPVREVHRAYPGAPVPPEIRNRPNPYPVPVSRRTPTLETGVIE